MSALVLSPHPDDESIGCGGTLRKHALAGEEVHVIFLTSGEAGGHGLEDVGAVREKEAARACSLLGVSGFDFWHLPDGQLEMTDATVTRLKALLDDKEPRYLYVPHEGEMHPDHRAATSLTAAALAGSALSPDIRCYEVWTPMQRMDHIEDVSAVMDTKLEAVRAYASQCGVLRFDEAIAGLNRYRGEMHSWPGGPYAEVFQSLRRSS